MAASHSPGGHGVFAHMKMRPALSQCICLEGPAGPGRFHSA